MKTYPFRLICKWSKHFLPKLEETFGAVLSNLFRSWDPLRLMKIMFPSQKNAHIFIQNFVNNFREFRGSFAASQHKNPSFRVILIKLVPTG